MMKMKKMMLVLIMKVLRTSDEVHSVLNVRCSLVRGTLFQFSIMLNCWEKFAMGVSICISLKGRPHSDCSTVLQIWIDNILVSDN
jgi:hypothetical protein